MYGGTCTETIEIKENYVYKKRKAEDIKGNYLTRYEILL